MVNFCESGAVGTKVPALDADVLTGEAEGCRGQRDRCHAKDDGEVARLQPVEEGRAVVVEGGKPKRGVRPLQVRTDEADEEPASEQEADQARVDGRADP